MNDLFSIKKVGYMYFNGLGTNKDDKLAAYYYELASDRGDIRAIINYSQLLIIGDDSDRNINEARRYLKIGAEQGDEECINELQKLDQIEESTNDDEIYQHSFILEKGNNGETRNLEQAREYYQMSADAGEVRGMLNYARFLQNYKIKCLFEDLLVYLQL
ncbi:hypothetical protein M9Y10_011208 [Tritrichomonas musculus]|uniref:Sel1 repeat family protein n=1 Tax=Tritrichomonas musculus TaxID=1915356 RepID=A0ABR2IIU2_9EUKA